MLMLGQRSFGLICACMWMFIGCINYRSGCHMHQGRLPRLLPSRPSTQATAKQIVSLRLNDACRLLVYTTTAARIHKLKGKHIEIFDQK